VFVFTSYAHVSPRSVVLSFPPNKMTRSDFASYAIAWRYRAGGRIAGFMFVQVFVSKSYVQVSAKTVFPSAVPPNRTTRSDWASYAIADRYRGDGRVPGFRFVHVFLPKSKLQVSASVAAPVEPPNKMTRSDWMSYAIAWRFLADGFVDGFQFFHVFASKS
jgi:hypothetical protein